MGTRRTVDHKNSGKSERYQQTATGVAGTRMSEGHVRYIQADNEHVINDANGSYIVLGRDRPASRISGRGNEHNSSRIDMVVGRGSADDVKAFTNTGQALLVDPSFRADAARIYISAKSDIDQYFNLEPGKVGMSMAKSSVGIKADAIRIVAREGIKLVTRPEPINSQTGVIEFVKGIDLIAGNDDRDLQPLVKGRNLVQAMGSIIDYIGKLNGIVDLILLHQQKMNLALQFHTHISTLPGVPTTPPDPLFQGIASTIQTASVLNGTLSLKLHRTAGVNIRLQHFSQAGTGYILSRQNNTN